MSKGGFGGSRIAAMSESPLSERLVPHTAAVKHSVARFELKGTVLSEGAAADRSTAIVIYAGHFVPMDGLPGALTLQGTPIR
jgi:hypothetical protein